MKTLSGLILSFVAVTLLLIFPGSGKRRIAIFDSGLSPTDRLKPFLCESGHKSFLPNGRTDPFEDETGHGTMVATVISEYINPKTDCLVIYRTFPKEGGSVATMAYYNGLIEAIPQKFDTVVIALEDEGYYLNEVELFKKLTTHSRAFIAAGNAQKALDKKCDVFPACLALQVNSKNFRVVGDLDGDFNFGQIITDREPSKYSMTSFDYHGSSVSTARAAAKYIVQLGSDSQSNEEKNRRSISSK